MILKRFKTFLKNTCKKTFFICIFYLREQLKHEALIIIKLKLTYHMCAQFE